MNKKLGWIALAVIVCLGISFGLYYTGVIGGKSGTAFSYKLIPVKKDGKWGYIDHDGKYVINPQFSEAYLFSGGLALVKNSDDKWGYIDESGRFAIMATYRDATNFVDGLAMVVPPDGHPTCINKAGKVRFVLKDADRAGTFHEGMAWVKVGEKFGYINDDGKVVITPQFYLAGDFRDGLAIYGVKNPKDSAKSLYGFIDKKGKIVVNAQFASLSEISEGAALAGNSDGKLGYIDRKGHYIINPQFEEAGSFSDGLAPVKQGKSWGYISKDGKLAINPQFEEAGLFHQGLAPVRSGEDEWGYINKEGKIVINPQFKTADAFHDGVALVASGDDVGLIDKDGKYMVNPQFESTTNMFLDKFYPMYEFLPGGTVTSDFFNAQGIAAKAIGNTDHARLRGVGRSTSYQTLKGTLPGTATESNSDHAVEDGTDYNLAPGVDITSTNYYFDQELYTYSYSSYSYDYSKEYNPQNKLEHVLFTIGLNSYGRTADKAVRLGQAIRDQLLRKGAVSETGTEGNSTEYRRTQVANWLKEHNSDKEKSWYLFGKGADYLVNCDIEKNVVSLVGYFRD